VEGILTLQLSHLNVVHTFRAVTIPAQVRHALTSLFCQFFASALAVMTLL